MEKLYSATRFQSLKPCANERGTRDSSESVGLAFWGGVVVEKSSCKVGQPRNTKTRLQSRTSVPLAWPTHTEDLCCPPGRRACSWVGIQRGGGRKTTANCSIGQFGSTSNGNFMSRWIKNDGAQTACFASGTLLGPKQGFLGAALGSTRTHRAWGGCNSRVGPHRGQNRPIGGAGWRQLYTIQLMSVHTTDAGCLYMPLTCTLRSGLVYNALQTGHTTTSKTPLLTNFPTTFLNTHFDSEGLPQRFEKPIHSSFICTSFQALIYITGI